MPRRDRDQLASLRRLGAADHNQTPTAPGLQPRPPRPPRRRGRRVTLWVAIGLAVLVAAAGGVLVARDLLRTIPPEPAVDAWLRAWQAEDYAGMQAMLAGEVDVLDDVYTRIREDLGVTGMRLTPGAVTVEDGEATAAFTAALTLRGLGEWRYQGQLDLVLEGEEWRVAWSPSAIHPALATAEDRLVRDREWPQRAPILDRNGQPLTQTQETVTIGLRPDRITERQALFAALERELGDRADLDAVAAQLDDPGTRPDAFVPVAELPAAVYQQVRPVLHPIPGTVFTESATRSAPPAGLQSVLGVTREATAEDLEELGEPYQAGDRVGVSGLEDVRETQLAGQPAWQVRAVSADAAEGDAGEVLHREDGQQPEPVATTIDPRIQAAAAAAVRGTGSNRNSRATAVVALQASTGEVRAAVSTPEGGLNRAFSGHYPPGSTFKVVTATALLGSGLQPTGPVECTPTITVEGRSFRNFEGGSLGTVPFRQVFAESCNTGFIRAAGELPDGALGEAAENFGFNLDYKVEPPAFTGQFPQPGSATEAAAAAIGQGRVLSSPLHMASVAAAVAAGAWRPPSLVRGAEPAAEPRPLDPAVVEQLRSLMREVVVSGSGTALAGIPGAAGKSGTAEFGQGDPLPTHAWFIGFRGDLAYAVLIEDGGVGGRDAAPVAARFLGGL